MKKVALLTLLYLSSTAFNQTTEEKIDQIREWFKKTEASLSDCKVVKYNAEYFEGSVPEVTAYYSTIEKRFIKISVYSGQDWHEETVDYYVGKNGKVYFTYTTGYYGEEFYTAEEKGMSEEEYFEYGRDAKTLEHYQLRSYFNNAECIRYLEKRNITPAEQKDDLFDGVKNKTIDCPKDAYLVAQEQAEDHIVGATKELNK